MSTEMKKILEVYGLCEARGDTKEVVSSIFDFFY